MRHEQKKAEYNMMKCENKCNDVCTLTSEFRAIPLPSPLRSLLTGVRGVLVFAVLMLLSSCGGKSGHFRIEGRFRSLNQGEFYIYNSTGGIVDVDTIKVSDGRFAYEIPLEDKATFFIIFPNFSEHVVFGEPGAVVKVKGDASHLREMEITGTDDNKLMTNFRLNANKMSPPEVVEAAVKFVTEHPRSPVSLYLVNKYLILTQSPDYAKAYGLVTMMRKEDPENASLLRLADRLENLKASVMGGRLPDFSATDIKGRRVGRSLLKGKVNVISAWATWSYDSQKMQRRLKVLEKKYGKDLAVVSVCLDARKSDCEKWLERDSIGWPNVCDGKMWDTPLLHKVGIATVPGNLVADKEGKIIARNIDSQQLEDKIALVLK